jgi:chemotaxis protein CheX
MALPQINPNFFKPFVDGAVRTLRIQCNLEATTEKPFIKGTVEQPSFGIAAIIGVISSSFTGTITLCFTESVFLGIMSNMLGEKYTSITPDLEDGAAELLNIIFGQAKVVLSSQNIEVQKAIPTVIRGDNLRTANSSRVPVIVIPFRTPLGLFQFEIATEETKRS